ncbi:hypothetical protein HD806DRAFT_491247 [Xylariaceae sp. AK1471]|nr:hypothetical protein HD806DRAFT_491247 [Xylariaceae sp. AK1471]
MEHLTQAEFAQRAADRVSEVVRELLENWSPKVSSMLEFARGYNLTSKMNRKRRLSALMAHLIIFSVNLAKYEQGEYNWREEETAKLETLLLKLELACTFPQDALGKTSEQAEPSARFPMLNRLLEQRETPYEVAQSLKKFASIPKNTQPLMELLRGFDRTQEQARRDAKQAQQQIEGRESQRDWEKKRLDEDESYPQRVYDMVRRFVQTFRACHCDLPHSYPKAPKRHWGRLELRERLSTTNDDILFHAVFSKKGSVDFVDTIKWQHLQLHVPRRSNKKQSARIDITEGDSREGASTPDGGGKESLHANENPLIKSVSEFCQFLGVELGPVSLDVRIMDEVCDEDDEDVGLVDLDSAADVEVNITDERSTSLADVLNCGDLLPGNKLLIAYVLAKSVWQFYAWDWVIARWTSESIQFFREKKNSADGKSTVNWAPYYAFSFEEIPSEEHMERLEGKITHQYPRVLALGALLYELGLKTGSTRPIGSGICPGSFRGKINSTAHTIRTGLDCEDWPDFGLKNPEVLAKYRLVVAACVDKSVFTPKPAELTTEAYKRALDGPSTGCTSPAEVTILQKTPSQLEQELSIEDRRAVLYRKIVLPLREILQGAGWVDENGDINRRKMQRPATHQSENPSSARLLINSSSSQAAPGGKNDVTGPSSSVAADEWLANHKSSSVMTKLVTAFDETELADKRIRIAVLDTGYDPGAIFFDRDRRSRLKDWKDYVERDRTIKDEDGHGTHVLSVLMQVAPAADIYVARIARGTPDLLTSSANVAEAIKWAWNECQANIVTMSFGFDDEQYVDGKPVISNAISDALTGRDQRILFFAAAANDGGNRKEMFPARNRNVFSIRGTDEYGWVQGFNPPPDYNGETCFMTLGKDVPGASLSTSEHGGGEVCQSGTSVATPIAAGIAAMVLGYAKIHENEIWEFLKETEEHKRYKIENIYGMTEFFIGLSTEMLEKWSYLKISEFEDKSHKMRLSDIASAARKAKG